MKIEILVYAYLAVCVAMIGFNTVCIFIFRWKDKRLDRYSEKFIRIVRRAIEDGSVDEEHSKYMLRKLKRTGNFMAFDRTLEELFAHDSDSVIGYLHQLSPVFVSLTLEYQKKGNIQAAYFAYIINKYKLFQNDPSDIVIDTMMDLVRTSSLYVRENALQAIYSTGSEEHVMEALWVLNESLYYHHSKMITDGLLGFTGDRAKLDALLWQYFDRFTIFMQEAILNYFRFSTSGHKEKILQLLQSGHLDDELAFSCIRYFGKYRYEPAYPLLIHFAENSRKEQWEYAAIAASALAAYPGDRTIGILKKLLQNANWFVRYNASQSLMQLGLYYTDLIDIFEGHDRYAGEIMRYRFDQKKMYEKEAMGIE